MRVSVQEADFDVGAETEALAAGRPEVGAVASFVGYVRADKLAGESAEDQAVSAMTLEHYPGMTEKSLEAIVAEAESRWSLLGVRVIHRFGRLVPVNGATARVGDAGRQRVGLHAKRPGDVDGAGLAGGLLREDRGRDDHRQRQQRHHRQHGPDAHQRRARP